MAVDRRAGWAMPDNECAVWNRNLLAEKIPKERATACLQVPGTLVVFILETPFDVLLWRVGPMQMRIPGNKVDTSLLR
jgi:hypothetical protein